jgi:hypothetical protein
MAGSASLLIATFCCRYEASKRGGGGRGNWGADDGRCAAAVLAAVAADSCKAGQTCQQHAASLRPESKVSHIRMGWYPFCFGQSQSSVAVQILLQLAVTDAGIASALPLQAAFHPAANKQWFRCSLRQAVSSLPCSAVAVCCLHCIAAALPLLHSCCCSADTPAAEEAPAAEEVAEKPEGEAGEEGAAEEVAPVEEEVKVRSRSGADDRTAAAGQQHLVRRCSVVFDSAVAGQALWQQTVSITAKFRLLTGCTPAML